ncbi:MAG: hypothetical protein RXR09_00560 [Acidilobus sp.]
MSYFNLYLLMLLIALLAATTAMTMKQMSDLKKLQEMKRRPKIITVEQCGSSITTRDFREGDYVGLATGSCTDGTPKRIIGIYALKEEGKKRGTPM